MGLRFLADSNVGRLARWLRALGYDARFEPALSDPELVRLALAEERVLLTRDRDLLQRRVFTRGTARSVLLRHDGVLDQLRQVVQELSLTPDAALTRCLECNRELEPRDLDQVAERVPPYVRATQSRYAECPGCGRVYWAGTHWARMRGVLAGLC
ncbi:MAG TPA: Mut7-C RNAse domain-containing protein [Candidatus Acidoferrales bacterium]|nr:Mut7-C RNAse domain-containing protein [Candidatus Acidoferrales bacterium]